MSNEQEAILLELAGTFEWVLDRLDWDWLDYLYPREQDRPVPWVAAIGNGSLWGRPGTPERAESEAKVLEVVAALRIAAAAIKDQAAKI